MAELTQAEKDKLTAETIKAIEREAQLHGLNFATFSKEYISFLIGVFIAGASVALQTLKKNDVLEN